jgi:hypothetical protein
MTRCAFLSGHVIEHWQAYGLTVQVRFPLLVHSAVAGRSRLFGTKKWPPQPTLSSRRCHMELTYYNWHISQAWYSHL